MTNRPRPRPPAAKPLGRPSKPQPLPTQPAAPKQRSIIDALDNPQVFAPFFKGDSWTAWRAFFKSLFALSMTETELALYQKHTARTTPPSEPFKEAALVIGRRGGKSRALATIAAFLAIFRDYTAYLAPGEVATIAIIASDRKQARVIFRYLLGLLRAVPALSAMIMSETDDRVELSNRITIEIATASFRVTRGYSFAAVLADETAYWRTDDNSANPDMEIFRALRPGMSTIPGAILLNASSPYRRQGVLWNAYAKFYGRDDGRVLIWQADTAAMNPNVDPVVIEEAYRDDPESAAAEYGAQFRSDISEYISQETLETVVEFGVHERPPARSVAGEYCAFIDAAGGSGSDSMTLAIGHLDEDGVAVLDLVMERRPPFSPDDCTADFSLALRSYGVTQATSDRWGGDWVSEAFRKRGIVVTPSARPKSDLYREFLPLINGGRCSLLDNQRLLNQFVGLERRVVRGGRDSVDHAPTGHDDLANAAAGCLVGAATELRPSLVKASDLLGEDGQGVLMPAYLETIFVVVSLDDTGGCAAVFFGVGFKHQAPRLVILDYDDRPLSGSTYRDVRTRLEAFSAIRFRLGAAACFCPPEICGRFAQIGIGAEPLPPALDDDPISLLTAASAFISLGDVKISALAMQKAQSSPLGAALSFRGGDPTNPLRRAIVSGIVLALEDVANLPEAFQPA